MSYPFGGNNSWMAPPVNQVGEQTQEEQKKEEQGVAGQTLGQPSPIKAANAGLFSGAATAATGFGAGFGVAPTNTTTATTSSTIGTFGMKTEESKPVSTFVPFGLQTTSAAVNEPKTTFGVPTPTFSTATATSTQKPVETHFGFGVAPVKPTNFESPVKSAAVDSPAKPAAWGTPVKSSATFDSPVKPITFNSPAKQASSFDSPAKPLAFNSPAKPGAFDSPAKSTTFASPAKPATTPMDFGFGSVKPFAPVPTTSTSVASPAKPVVSQNPDKAPFSFGVTATSTASPAKPVDSPLKSSLEKANGTPRKSSLEKATPMPLTQATNGTPRKSSLEKATPVPAVQDTSTTPRKSSIETPRKRSFESDKAIATPQSLPKPAAATPTPTTNNAASLGTPVTTKTQVNTPAATVVTPSRPDDSAAKAKESAAILNESLKQAPSAFPVQQKQTLVDSPIAKKYRSESIDDSWVKIDKEEAIAEEVKKEVSKEDVKKEAKTDVKKEAKKEKLATPKNAKVEKPTSTRRTSGRARQAPKEEAIVAAVTTSKSSTTKAIAIPTGSGQPLGDIPHVAAQLNKMKAADKTMLLVHRLIFGRPGEANKRKADLRQFNGLPANTDAAALDKKLSAQTLPALKSLLVLFNLERSGEKLSVVERLRGFLMNPKDFGKSKPAPPAKKKSAATKKKATSAKASKSKASSSKKSTKKEKSPQLTPDLVESEDDYAEEIASLKAEATKQ